MPHETTARNTNQKGATLISPELAFARLPGMYPLPLPSVGLTLNRRVVVQVLDQMCSIDLRSDADKQSLARHLGRRPVGDHVAIAIIVGWSANEHVLPGRMLPDTPMRSVLFKRPEPLKYHLRTVGWVSAGDVLAPGTTLDDIVRSLI